MHEIRLGCSLVHLQEEEKLCFSSYHKDYRENKYMLGIFSGGSSVLESFPFWIVHPLTVELKRDLKKKKKIFFFLTELYAPQWGFLKANKGKWRTIFIILIAKSLCQFLEQRIQRYWCCNTHIPQQAAYHPFALPLRIVCMCSGPPFFCSPKNTATANL